MSDRSKEVDALLNLVSYIRSETARLEMEDAAYFADLLRTVIAEQSGEPGEEGTTD